MNLIFFIGLLAAHTLSYDHLHEKIDEDIDILKEKLNQNEDKEKLNSLKRIIMLSTEVAYSKWKPGKRKRRKQIRDALRFLGFDPEDLLNKDEAFMLTPSYSRAYKIVFFIVPALVITTTIFPPNLVKSIVP